MRKYLVLGLLSVFTLVGGTAVAAGLLAKQQQTFYFNKGSQGTPSSYFNANNWDEFDTEGGCGEDSQVPCHLEAADVNDLQDILNSYSNLDELLIEAGERP